MAFPGQISIRTNYKASGTMFFGEMKPKRKPLGIMSAITFGENQIQNISTNTSYEM